MSDAVIDRSVKTGVLEQKKVSLSQSEVHSGILVTVNT